MLEVELPMALLAYNSLALQLCNEEYEHAKSIFAFHSTH